jgi:hypothetical protein
MYTDKPGITIREVLSLEEKPKGGEYQPKEDGTSAMYAVGPFKTYGAAELFKDRIGKFTNVAEAERAFAHGERASGNK